RISAAGRIFLLRVAQLLPNRSSDVCGDAESAGARAYESEPARHRAAAPQPVNRAGDPGPRDHDAFLRGGKAHGHLRLSAHRTGATRRDLGGKVYYRGGLDVDHDRTGGDFSHYSRALRLS